MNKDNNFGLKLKSLRTAKGLTQAQLAEMADLHEKHISKLELGICKPNFETLNKIFKALDLNMDEVDVELTNVSANDNPFYIKSMQILNEADEKEIEFYYSILKTAQKGLNDLKD